MAYYVDKYGVIVDIRLDPGVYVFTGRAASGKTYLASLLREYTAYEEPVTSYDYLDFSKGMELSALIQSDKYKVLMIDRYDMFYGEALEVLQNPPSNMTILIDTKRMDWAMKPSGICAISYRGGRLLVT